MSEDLIKKYKENPNLSKEWVKSLLKRINARSEKLNDYVAQLTNRLSDNDLLGDYYDIIEEFDVEYSTLQEDLNSFHALFLES